MTLERDLVFVDTNVLLAATVPNRELHGAARRVLEEWPSRGPGLCLNGQVLREYLVVATRPPAVNGLGLETTAALANVAAFRGRHQLLEEDARCAEHLSRLVREHGLAGTRIHDAGLVATALAHGVGRLVTANVGDFAALAGEIEILDLARA